MTATHHGQEAIQRGARMLRTALGIAIARFLEDPAVVEVMLNPDGRIWIDRLSEGLASGLHQPDTARVALEQENTKALLQRLHTGAEAGKADAECIGGMAEVEIFSDGERLNERYEGNARS